MVWVVGLGDCCADGFLFLACPFIKSAVSQKNWSDVMMDDGLTLSGSLHESCAAFQRPGNIGGSAGYSSSLCYGRAQLVILT